MSGEAHRFTVDAFSFFLKTRTKDTMSSDTAQSVTLGLGYCRIGVDEGNIQVIRNYNGKLSNNYSYGTYK